MSYLLDKKTKRNKFLKVGFGILLFLVLFSLRNTLWNGLSSVGGRTFKPVLSLGSGIGGSLKRAGAYFASKKSLYDENQNLQSKLREDEARMANYDALLAEDQGLKDMLGRKDPKKTMVLGNILSKPNQSPYDTLTIDIGKDHGIQKGETVFALGDVPIGRVDTVYDTFSKIVLFSSAGEKTGGVIASHANSGTTGVFMEITGRGGGNFEMIIPKDLNVQVGDQVTMPGNTSSLLATVVAILSDPRDPFTKALLVGPVNIQQLQFVEVQI